MKLDLGRWKMLWLNRGWNCRAVSDTDMIEIHGVQGFLVPGDVEFLLGLGRQLPPKGRYLEIGSWMGLSSIIVANGLIAAANYHAEIICVDTWKGSVEHQLLSGVKDGSLYGTFLRNIADAQVDQFIQPVRGESLSVAKGWTEPLDLVFIDGDHSLEGCYSDIVHWMPHLKKGGRMLGHDAVPGGPVERAVLQYCRENELKMRVYPFPQTHYIWELQTQTKLA